MDCIISVWFYFLGASVQYLPDGNRDRVPQENLIYFIENVEDLGFIYGNGADGKDRWFMDEDTELRFIWRGWIRRNGHNMPAMIQFYASDDHAYVMVYDRLDAYANPDGSYYGIHPCDAFEIQYDLYEKVRY